MFHSLFSFPTFLLFSPFRLVRSNTWVQRKHLTPELSIDLCLQTFPKLLLLLVPKFTTRSLYPECIANLKLPIDAFLSQGEFKPSSSDSADGGRSIIRVIDRWDSEQILEYMCHNLWQ